MVDRALEQHDLVMVDDLHLVTEIVNANDYRYLLDAALTAVLAEMPRPKKLVFACDGDPPWPIRRRAYSGEIGQFTLEDYEVVCRGNAGEAAAGLDFGRLHRFAPELNARQLRNACRWLVQRDEGPLDTESFLGYLSSQDLSSNVDLEEVARVDWSDLKGVDDLVRELEAKVALPFENDALSRELSLTPKRGVLLAGPPGTGKTTIGRALAHRLGGKFFLIDGTMVAGSSDFYCKLSEVFAAAQRNAPSVVFIDDADVIFEDNGHHGFYRYLLTMLDGLKSAGAGRVCVMMTAMHPGSLPQAILRSGRVELWLETSLPDGDARAAILRERLAGLPEPIGSADLTIIAAASQGLTGADLRNVVEDAKLLFAHDRSREKPALPVEEYFLEAIETVRKQRRNYLRSKPPKLAEAVAIGFTAAG
jgi:ATP-dependent 26S proteasome regulatory subunit